MEYGSEALVVARPSLASASGYMTLHLSTWYARRFFVCLVWLIEHEYSRGFRPCTVTIPPVQLGGWDGKQKQGPLALKLTLNSLWWKTERFDLPRADSPSTGRCVDERHEAGGEYHDLTYCKFYAALPQLRVCLYFFYGRSRRCPTTPRRQLML